MWLAKMGLAFRGHIEHEQSNNRGNFLERCHFRAESDVSFETFLKNSINYTHHDIQNELVHIITNKVRMLNLPNPGIMCPNKK